MSLTELTAAGNGARALINAALADRLRRIAEDSQSFDPIWRRALLYETARRLDEKASAISPDAICGRAEGEGG